MHVGSVIFHATVMPKNCIGKYLQQNDTWIVLIEMKMMGQVTIIQGRTNDMGQEIYLKLREQLWLMMYRLRGLRIQ